MSREVMQRALDMLNEIADHVYFDQTLAEVITALDQALEEKREPVAWANSFDMQNFDMKVRTCPDLHHTVPLYTAPPKRELTCVCGAVWEGETMVHPPREREWVGLTDEERHSIREWRGIQKELGPVWAPMLLYLYEAIEAKLREKNT